MITGQETRQVADLLRIGFLADRAVIELSDNAGQIDPAPFMELGELLDALTLSLTTVGPSPVSSPAKYGAKSNSRVDWEILAASGEHLTDVDDFVEYLRSVRALVSTVEQSETLDPQKQNDLQAFFDSIGKLSLTEAQALSRDVESRGRAAWPTELTA